MQSPLEASPSTRAPWRPPCSPRAPWGPSCPHRTLGAFPSTQSPLGATHPRGALGPGRVSPLACISIQVWEPELEEFVPIFDGLLTEVSPPAFRQGCGPQIPVTAPPPTCPSCCPQGHLRCLGRGRRVTHPGTRSVSSAASLWAQQLFPPPGPAGRGGGSVWGRLHLPSLLGTWGCGFPATGLLPLGLGRRLPVLGPGPARPCELQAFSSPGPSMVASWAERILLSHQDVVRAGSALLAPDTRAVWEQIQRSEGGTAQLLRRFEAYFSNVARNLRRTYLRPFVIVTSNLSTAAASVGQWGRRARWHLGPVWGAAPTRLSLGKGSAPHHPRDPQPCRTRCGWTVWPQVQPPGSLRGSGPGRVGVAAGTWASGRVAPRACCSRWGLKASLWGGGGAAGFLLL